MNQRRNTRWLELAVKARQWAVDAQGQELKLAQAATRSAEATEQQARHTLAHALAGRSAVLSRASFAATELADHGAYEGRLRLQIDAAAERALQAQGEEQSVREQVIESVSQRDALAGCRDKAHLANREDEARRAAREHDELWLIGAAAKTGGLA
jgi:hypothetical protein